MTRWYFSRLTEDEKLDVLEELERSGSVRMMANVLKGQLFGSGDLGVGGCQGEVRTMARRRQEVGGIGAKWGEGALLKLDDPVFVDLRAEGLLNPDIIRNAEAYGSDHSALPEFNAQSAL